MWLLLQIKLAQTMCVGALVVELAEAGVHEVFAEFGFVVGAEVLNVLQHVFAWIKLDLLFWSLHSGHKLSSISCIPSKLLHQGELGLSLMVIAHSHGHLRLYFERLKSNLRHSHCVTLLLVRKAFTFFFVLAFYDLLTHWMDTTTGGWVDTDAHWLQHLSNHQLLEFICWHLLLGISMV